MRFLSKKAFFTPKSHDLANIVKNCKKQLFLAFFRVDWTYFFPEKFIIVRSSIQHSVHIEILYEKKEFQKMEKSTGLVLRVQRVPMGSQNFKIHNFDSKSRFGILTKKNKC